jgi:hypothetical protein
MRAGEAIAEALDQLAAERTSYLSLHETVELLGGNRKAAETFGVNIRTVQRWLKQNGGQQRRLAKSYPRIREAVAREQRALAAEQMEEDLSDFFLLMQDAEVRISKDRRKRSGETPAIGFDPDERKAVIAAYRRSDTAALERAFAPAFFAAWGQGRMGDARFGDIGSLIIVPN